MLGYTGDVGVASDFSIAVGDSTTSVAPVLMSNVDCLGTEQTLFDCPHLVDNTCTNEVDDAGVNCLGRHSDLLIGINN